MRSTTGRPPPARGQRATTARGEGGTGGGRRRGVAGALSLGVLLAACGGTVGSDGESAGSDDGAVDDPQQEAAIAPECAEVDPLVAEMPEGVDPVGSGAEPVDDPLLPGGDEADPAVEEPVTLYAQIERWGQQEAEESFAGVWFHEEAGAAVAFVEDVEGHADRVREAFYPGIAVAEADTTYADLLEAQRRIQEQEMGQDPDGDGAVRTVGSEIMINRTTVGLFAPDEERLAELSETYGASTICFEIDPGPEPLPDGVEPLAKASDWRPGLAEAAGGSFAVIEVAYDRETAERAWEANVPADLDVVEDDLPAEPGLYGDLDEVDLDRQAIVVWSSGESGSCPGWLSDIRTVDGQVQVERGATEDECTGDYNPYRMVLAVDLDRLPEPADLPLHEVEDLPDGLVAVYPSDEDG